MATIDDINNGNYGSRRRRAKKNDTPMATTYDKTPIVPETSDVANATDNTTSPSSTTITTGIDKNDSSQVVETPKDTVVAQPKTMEELVNILHPQKSAEDIEAENKRERRRQMWAAIGDGISSLANLYFTTKGAPPITDTSNLSGKAQQKWDELVKEREAETAARRKAQIDAIKWDREDAYRRNKDEREEAKFEYTKALAEAKDERDAALDGLKMDLYAKKIDTAEYKRQVEEIKAKYAEKKEEAEVNRKNRSGGGSNKEPFTIEGKEFRNIDEAKKYVYKRAKDLNINTFVEDDYGTKTKRDWHDVAAEIDANTNNSTTNETRKKSNW